MKLLAYQKQLGARPEVWLRQAGYQPHPDRSATKPSFIRRLTRDHYPRYHIYYQTGTDKAGTAMLMFELHLDQKKPAYQGFRRHNAEYDGDLVAQEIKRLQALLK